MPDELYTEVGVRAAQALVRINKKLKIETDERTLRIARARPTVFSRAERDRKQALHS